MDDRIERALVAETLLVLHPGVSIFENQESRLRAPADEVEHCDPARITVREWLTTWLSTVKPEVSPKTHERYGQFVDGFLVPELRNYALAKLMPANIQTAYTKWASAGRLDGKPGGPSPSTRRAIHHILRSALSRAVEQQLLPRNPADVFKRRLPKVERKEMATLNAEQSARLLDALRHTRVYWPCLLALSTGARRGEILALRWKNVDLETGMVSIRESLEQTKALGLRFKNPKNEKARTVALPRYAIEELRRLKREQAEELLKLGVR